MKRDFLDLADLSTAEVWSLLELAVSLREEWVQGGNKPRLKGKTLALVFQKPSLRTRVSFDVAAAHLGGAPYTCLRTKSSSASARASPMRPGY